MKKTQWIEFFREIKHSVHRYLSILFMVTLGVAFYMGICSSEPDMQRTADALFDETNLMDIRIISTLGLTDEDVEASSKVDGVTTAEGAYAVDVLTEHNDNEYVLQVISACESANQMTVKEGRMPNNANECFLDESFIHETGYQIGDSIQLTSGNEDPLSDSLVSDSYTIVGYGSYSQYLSWHRGSTKIGKGSLDAFLVVPKESFSMDAYTSIYITVDSAKGYNSYEETYEDAIEAVKDNLEAIKEDRQRIRYASVKDEATIELEDAKNKIKEAEDELSDAGLKLSDAEKEIKDGEKELAKAEKELNDAAEKIQDGETQIADAKAELSKKDKEIKDAKKQLKSAKKELTKNEKRIQTEYRKYEDGLKEYKNGKKQYTSGFATYERERAFYQQALPQKGVLSTSQGYQASLLYFQQLTNKQKQGVTLNQKEQGELLLLGRILPEIKKATASYDNPPDAVLSGVVSGFFTSWDETLKKSGQTLNNTKKQLDTAKKELKAAKKQLDSALKKIENGKKTLQKNEAKLKKGEDQLNEAKTTIKEKEAELADGKVELKDGKKKLKDAREELEDGNNKLNDAKEEYAKAKKEADEKLNDAKEKVADGEEALADLEEPEWYILDRNSIQNYVEYGMDSKKIGAIGKVFPVIFFLVAALVSLTTMTRMVEENRTQIGTLKALGYGKLSISLKYVLYAFSASLLGGALGILVGSYYLPLIIMRAYCILYENLTVFYTPIQLRLSLFSLSVAIFCTVFATILACYKELLSTPASLMRPVPPKKGKRVLLERIPLIWNHLNFTKKATVRNLIRYKKRLFMTIFGIGGCMALLMVSFGLRDSISEIADHQYSTLWVYDAELSIDTENVDNVETVSSTIEAREDVEDGLLVSQSSMDFQGKGVEKSGTLFVPSDLSTLQNYIIFKNRNGHETYDLTDDGAIITEKLASLLNLGVGDTLTIKEDDTKYHEVSISAITENYINHFVYLTPNLYEDVFHEPPEYDHMLLHLSQDGKEEPDALSSDLLKEDYIGSILMVSELRDNISDMMQSLDMVIWVLIVSAGLLAFVVLFNLNNINITERRRELATIKVLGFYDFELAEYVYRENVILTVLGIAAGIAIGLPLHQFVIRTCEIDMMMFCRIIKPASYLYSVLLTIAFSLLVNAGMYFTFKKIDMVESLKSVE